MISQGTLCLSLIFTDRVSAGFLGIYWEKSVSFVCSCSYQTDWVLNTAFPLHAAPNLSPSTTLLSRHLGIWETMCWGFPSVHCQQWSCCQRPWREDSSKCLLQPSPAQLMSEQDLLAGSQPRFWCVEPISTPWLPISPNPLESWGCFAVLLQLRALASCACAAAGSLLWLAMPVTAPRQNKTGRTSPRWTRRSLACAVCTLGTKRAWISSWVNQQEVFFSHWRAPGQEESMWYIFNTSGLYSLFSVRNVWEILVGFQCGLCFCSCPNYLGLFKHI